MLAIMGVVGEPKPQGGVEAVNGMINGESLVNWVQSPWSG